jgi:outer membrane protein assembly factor BamB
MKLFPVFSLILVLTAAVHGANWPQFRGPYFNGSTDETGLPTDFSPTQNVVWHADLPGPSAATPVVWDNHVFISSAVPAGNGDNPNQGRLAALCFDRQTGKPLWQHSFASEFRRDSRSTYSAPTPATDGKLVVFFFGSGELLAFDFAGKSLWSRNIEADYGPFAFQWTYSASPVLFQGTLYLQVLQRDVPVKGRGGKDGKAESYLLAINPQTGETLWRHVRPCEAVAESREAFTTPLPFEHAGRKELIVAGGDDLTGHDLATGKELWRWGTWNPTRVEHWRLVPSPVAGKDVILVCAPKGDPIYAVKAGGNGRLQDSVLAWTSKDVRELSSDVPTPAYYDGDFFVLNKDRKIVSRVAPESGQIKWSTALPRGSQKDQFEASPMAADGKLYLVNFSGEVVIINAADGTVINKIAMDEPRDEPVRSTVVASHGQLFIRTSDKLYCIGK